MGVQRVGIVDSHGIAYTKAVILELLFMENCFSSKARRFRYPHISTAQWEPSTEFTYMFLFSSTLLDHKLVRQ